MALHNLQDVTSDAWASDKVNWHVVQIVGEPAANSVEALFGPRPKNADTPMLKVEGPCRDAEECARLKGK